MGGRLMSWSLAKLDLSPLDQVVLTAICKVADDSHGRFWKHPDDFLREDVPQIKTRTSLRDHLASLQNKGYVGRIRCGNGKPSKRRHKRDQSDKREPLGPSHLTEYQILALDVVGIEWIAAYEAINAARPRRKAPIQRQTPVLPSVAGGKSDTQMSDSQDARVSAPPDSQDARVSAPPDSQSNSPYYMNTKGEIDAKDDINPHHDHADDDDESAILFSDSFLQIFIERANLAFDLAHLDYCTATCTYHSPILASDFAYLGGGTASPDASAADQIIAGTLAANPRYLLRYLRKSLENLLSEADRQQIERIEPMLPSYRKAPPPTPPEPELRVEEREPLPPTPLCPEALTIWSKALEELRAKVARPAFETWLSDTVGVSHDADVFVVGTTSSFVAEMLEHRMYPLIGRAVEQVTGTPVRVHFKVVRFERKQEAS